ncbi:MAG: hypothetical protein NTY05_13905 [Rhodocyclales bacterium]|nr:hypothetical protein [Rhodocyclales bacterium]
MSILILPHSASAVATTPDLVLRRSEQIDMRRLGKVSEDERSVLRIEWRVAVTGADEARAVQNMLDSLRRLEQTMGDVGRLVRTMPAQKPVAVANTAEPPESGDFNSRLALANITAAGLVALWWFRRRNSAKHSGAKASFAPEAGTPVAPSPLEIPPATAPMAETEPVAAPPADTAASDPSPVQRKPAAATPAAESLTEEPRREPLAAKEAIKAEPVPAPAIAAVVERTASPEVAETRLPAPLPVTESPVIDFILEDADPEVAARENAKLKRLRITPPPEAPAIEQQTNVEPTLQLAEIMLSMGLEQGAAQALVEYTEANPRHAVYHWLKLLGIYRSKGLLKEFKETAEKLRQHFNIQAEDSTTPDTGEVRTLENFSRVAQQMQEIWQQPEECITYLRHLLEDNREGARAGFPLSVAEEILWLIEIEKEMSVTPQTAGT